MLCSDFVKCGEPLNRWTSERIKCNYISICNILAPPRVLKTKIERSWVRLLSKYHVFSSWTIKSYEILNFLSWLKLESFATFLFLHIFLVAPPFSLLGFLERIAIFHEQRFSFQKHLIWGPSKRHNWYRCLTIFYEWKGELECWTSYLLLQVQSLVYANGNENI